MIRAYHLDSGGASVLTPITGLPATRDGINKGCNHHPSRLSRAFLPHLNYTPHKRLVNTIESGRIGVWPNAQIVVI